MNQPALQAIVVKDPVGQPNTLATKIALFDEDGAPWSPGPESNFVPAAFQAPSQAETVEDLVSDFNELLLKLQAAGLMSDTGSPVV